MSDGLRRVFPLEWTDTMIEIHEARHPDDSPTGDLIECTSLGDLRRRYIDALGDWWEDSP